MFRPPFCPYRGCSAHHATGSNFYVRHGAYRAACRPRPVSRFRCKSCLRTFSRQTFRADFRDHRPDLNVPLLKLLACGTGLRESGRQLGLSLPAVEHKARKIGRHLRQLNLALRGPLPEGARFVFDELETYEGRRNTRPLTVPMLVEGRSLFLIWAESETLRPSGRMSEARKLAIQADEARFGLRRDRSARAIHRTLRRGAELLPDGRTIRVDTDEKSVYPRHLERALGKGTSDHHCTNSLVPRKTWNPLFPVNSEEARARDMMGRLRRESWLVSKRRRWLDIALHVHMAYRNYVRRRSLAEEDSPASMLGFVRRRLRPTELLSWRQVWGSRSPSPVGRDRRMPKAA